jgi:hypothetical protein
MLYYILMADKYQMLDNNRIFDKKPIDEVLETLEDLSTDIQNIKSDINHIKNYMKKQVVAKQLKEEQKDAEYVKEEKGWWW